MNERPEDLVLLARLSEALPVAAAVPSNDEVRALRMIVASTPPARRRRRRGWIAGLLAAGVIAGTGTAYAVAVDDVPRPVLGVADRIGLPVESPDDRDVRKAEARLAEELESGDPEDVADAAERLAEERADIDEDRSGSNRGPSGDDDDEPDEVDEPDDDRSGRGGRGSDDD